MSAFRKIVIKQSVYNFLTSGQHEIGQISSNFLEKFELIDGFKFIADALMGRYKDAASSTVNAVTYASAWSRA
jgi:hypothetical protein